MTTEQQEWFYRGIAACIGVWVLYIVASAISDYVR
jgi:hypothetical protein